LIREEIDSFDLGVSFVSFASCADFGRDGQFQIQIFQLVIADRQTAIDDVTIHFEIEKEAKK
jgi:hypothetical protein